VLVVLAECVVFGATGERFLTAANALEVLRQCVEVGLLALALTPVVITGGIDLSVGAMMGLAAVTLGALWRDAGAPLSLAVAGALAVGLAGGALNAVVIARLRYPPLIVTLGTMSLFRGVAQGLTRGVESYAGFPAPFLFLGQGYLGGVLPAQLVPFAAVAAACAWWLHGTTHGRGLYAIGHAADAARYAGIPVGRRLARFTWSRGSPRARRPWSTWPTSARPSRMRAPATSCSRSRRSCSAGPRFSAAGARWAERCSGYSRWLSCRTGCV
jgi:rhamnose transport system permease protein